MTGIIFGLGHGDGRGQLSRLALLMERGKTWRGYPALSQPLTIMGVERRWFLLSATLGLAMWNAINSIVTGGVIFAALYTSSGFGPGNKTLIIDGPPIQAREVSRTTTFAGTNGLPSGTSVHSARDSATSAINRKDSPMVKRKTKPMVKRKTKTKKKSKSKLELKPRTKSQIYGEISEVTDLTRGEVAAVFDAMSDLMRKDLGSRGPGAFTVPGLLKVVKVHKPRRPARKNVPNPFRPGEFMDVAAKPASKVVKVRPLKALKEMV